MGVVAVASFTVAAAFMNSDSEANATWNIASLKNLLIFD